MDMLMQHDRTGCVRSISIRELWRVERKRCVRKLGKLTLHDALSKSTPILQALPLQFLSTNRRKGATNSNRSEMVVFEDTLDSIIHTAGTSGSISRLPRIAALSSGVFMVSALSDAVLVPGGGGGGLGGAGSATNAVS